jgi:hypothetical protein
LAQEVVIADIALIETGLRDQLPACGQ